MMLVMGLRARLALFFIAITVIPLTVAVVVLQIQLSARIAEVTQRELQAAGASATVSIDAARARAGDVATDTARARGADVLAPPDTAAARELVTDTLATVPGRVDVVAVVAGNNQLLAADFSEPTEASLQRPSDAQLVAAVAEGAQVPGLLLEVREVRGGGDDAVQPRLGWIATGVWTDRELLATLVDPGGAAVVDGGRVLAATGVDPERVPTEDLPPPDATRALEIDGQRVRVLTVALDGDAGSTLVLWQSLPPALRIGLPLLALLIPAVLLAAAVGWVLASSVVAPVQRAARVARAVAAGDLDQTLEPSGGRELAALAGALNTMSAVLRERLEQLEHSRDQLRQSLSRLGQTLSSSLDLDRTLSVVVETAMETLGADRGVLWLFTPERDALYVKVGRGIGPTMTRLPTGAGIAGHVARVGVALRLPADRDTVPFPSDDEPAAHNQLAVPMVGRGRVLGVLTILRDDADRPFSQDDLDTLRSFAAQASVAMENVMLHREAQRLSVTDPLTGLWNFRYFQLQADRELESAARFERPLSLLIIDLDHFKAINDRFGHQVGDDVLLEVARRIQAATRVPDVVARYGGEEFVVLLPGTDFDGALATAERIREAVSASKIAITTARDIAPMSVTCSIGVSEHPRHGTTVAGLLRSADAAMYQAKTQGRDRVVGSGARRAGEPGEAASSRHSR